MFKLFLFRLYSSDAKRKRSENFRLLSFLFTREISMNVFTHFRTDTRKAGDDQLQFWLKAGFILWNDQFSTMIYFFFY